MRMMKQYLDAISPCLPPNAKIAVQAAASGFTVHDHPTAPFWKRIEKWDDDLRPEPWFDAVTIHLYPRLNEVVGRGAAKDPLTPPIARRNLRALMARVDEGTDN